MQVLAAIRAVWPSRWLLLGALTIGSFLFLTLVWPTPERKTLAGRPPETSLASQGGDLSQFLATLDADGRGLYAVLQLIDLGLVALYVPLLAMGLGYAASWRSPSVPPLLLALPVMAGVIDVVEDGGILASIGAFPADVPPVQMLFGVLVKAKLTMFVLSLIALAWVGAWALRDAMSGMARVSNSEAP